MKRVEGKVAIITGGAGGLGSAAASRLVEEGAKVLIADIIIDQAEEVAARLGANASAFRLDAFDAESIRLMVETAVERYGRLDILNNNVAHTGAGGTGADTNVIDTPIETWDQSFAINVRSYFIATKYALPHLLRTGNGSIINIASDSGLAGDSALVAYGSSKAAVVNFTRYVAAQYGRQGVRCNTICPGPIATDALKQHAPETLKSTLGAVYVPKIGEPKHIAALVAYFASDEAAYTNGATISCDGGLDAVTTPWMAPGGLMN